MNRIAFASVKNSISTIVSLHNVHSLNWSFNKMDIWHFYWKFKEIFLSNNVRLKITFFSYLVKKIKIIIHISSTLRLIHWVWHIALHTSIGIDKISPVCIIHGYHHIWWYDIFYNIRLKKRNGATFSRWIKNRRSVETIGIIHGEEIVDFRISIIIQIIGIQC